MSITTTRFELTADDGHRIQGITWQGDTPPRAHVQIAHGRGEYGGRYARVAARLVRDGFRVHASDHRGHGASAREAGTLGDFGARGFRAVIDDLAAVSRHLRATEPPAPLILFGHSMGSFAAQPYLLDHAALIDGLMLCGTAALDLRDPRHPDHVAVDFNAGIERPRTPCDWLSRDPAEVDAYLADPLCGFDLTPASRMSMFDDAARTADRQAYTAVPRALPIALLTGDRDPVNHFLALFTPLAARLRAFGFTDVSTHVFGGVRHEPFNDPTRDEVLDVMAAWMRRVASAGRG